MKIYMVSIFLLFPKMAIANELREIVESQAIKIQQLENLVDKIVKNQEKESKESIFHGRVSLSEDGNTVLFKAVNVQIVNGEGNTESVNGLGNLIVGYNESADRETAYCSNGSYQNESECESGGSVWGVNALKTGSHNIVGGTDNSYTQYGGLVVGSQNVINQSYATISGGGMNTASGQLSSISGGWLNSARGTRSSISGGRKNISDGYVSSVTGGNENTAEGNYSSISGGKNRSVTKNYDWRAGSLFEDQ